MESRGYIITLGMSIGDKPLNAIVGSAKNPNTEHPGMVRGQAGCLVAIGVPCLVVQTAHEIANSRRHSAIDRAFQEAADAQARLDQAKPTKSWPGTMDAAQTSLTEAH